MTNGGYQPKAKGAPSSPPPNPPNQESAGRANDRRLVKKPAPERPNIDAMVAAARGRPTDPDYGDSGPGPNWVETQERGVDAWYHLHTGKWYERRPARPTEPEGAEAALGRFLANWRNRRRQDADGVFARADLWHSVANVPVELLRELGAPRPKAAGKALLVLVPLGLACAAMVALAAAVLGVLVML